MSRARAVTAAACSPVLTARLARWTWSSARTLKPSLECDGIGAVDDVPPPPDVPVHHRSTVSGMLKLMGATCLVRSAVLQRWDADHDRARPLVIGVAKDGDRFAAHAWLEGEKSGTGFVELHRRPPSTGAKHP